MELEPDDLAGVVDLFGALTRDELGDALAELAFKRGEEYDPGVFSDDVAAAERDYYLLAVEPGAVTAGSVPDDAAELLVVGPVAFPSLPEGASDLPHILDVPERGTDRDAVGRAAEQRFRADAAVAVEADDPDRIAALLDASYELEAWAPVDLAAARDRLDAASE
ncbi:hypothetical protein ACKVMT_15340 [Halobacteriales archaeon Cl-PHB]